MSQMIQQSLELALKHHQAGRLQEAETIYRQVLTSNPDHPDALHLLGAMAFQAGKLHAARDMIQRAIEVNPNAAHYHCNLGRVYAVLRLGDEATSAFRRALELRPDYPEAHAQLGDVLGGTGHPDEAISELQRAIELRPNFPHVYNSLGNVFQSKLQWDDAIAAYRKAIEQKSDVAEFHNNLGNALFAAGKVDLAIEEYNKAISIRPEYPEAHNDLACAMLLQGKFVPAIEGFRKALAIRPNFAIAAAHLGEALAVTGKLDEAITAYRQALIDNPDVSETHFGLAEAFRLKGDPTNAITSYRRAVSLRPDYPEASNNLGNMLRDTALFDQAIVAYKQVLANHPDDAIAHFNLSIVLLLTGAYAQGWDEYEWRWRIKEFAPFRKDFAQPMWDGADLGGRRILLHAEQGFGDTIQFIRYAPLVAQRGGKIILGCEPEMFRLLKNIAGIEHILAEGRPLPPFDVRCPLPSLPRLFNTTLESIPATIPYINADPAGVEVWRKRFPADDRRKVGLVWAGRIIPDPNRAIPLAKLAALAEVPETSFFSLQKGDAAAEGNTPPAGMELIDFSSELQDFADSAALIANLDLVITVDTAVAHLAGAMGKPVWVLLPFVPDWRWLLDRDDSPWYPTMRLFRQPAAGDWDNPISQIVQALRSFKMDTR